LQSTNNYSQCSTEM